MVVTIFRSRYRDAAVVTLLHFIARHPDAALTDKLALELIVQTNTEHRWRQRRQQRERAGQRRSPAPQRIVRQPGNRRAYDRRRSLSLLATARRTAVPIFLRYQVDAQY